MIHNSTHTINLPITDARGIKTLNIESLYKDHNEIVDLTHIVGQVIHIIDGDAGIRVQYTVTGMYPGSKELVTLERLRHNDLLDIYVKTYGDRINTHDAAHRLDHMLDVYDAAWVINLRLGLGYSDDLLIHFAMSHDLYTLERDTHHILSYNHVLETNDLPYAGLSTVDRCLVAKACLKHRASYSGEYGERSEFEELCASADRMLPTSARQLVDRAIKYRAGNDIPALEQVVDAHEHVKEKYLTRKSTYPKMYSDVFESEIAKRAEEIRSFDPVKHYMCILSAWES